MCTFLSFCNMLCFWSSSLPRWSLSPLNLLLFPLCRASAFSLCSSSRLNVSSCSWRKQVPAWLRHQVPRLGEEHHIPPTAHHYWRRLHGLSQLSSCELHGQVVPWQWQRAPHPQCLRATSEEDTGAWQQHYLSRAVSGSQWGVREVQCATDWGGPGWAVNERAAITGLSVEHLSIQFSVMYSSLVVVMKFVQYESRVIGGT